MAIIICGFPGIGKSYAAQKHPLTTIDADSSRYNHDFKAYVNDIVETAKNEDIKYIFVSCHKEVRDELFARGVPYIIVVPFNYCLNKYIKRFLQRGNSIDFINKIYKNWSSWIDDIENYEVKRAIVIHLGNDEYITDIL